MGLYVYTGPPILAPASFRNPEWIPGNNPRSISERIPDNQPRSNSDRMPRNKPRSILDRTQPPSRHKDPS